MHARLHAIASLRAWSRERACESARNQRTCGRALTQARARINEGWRAKLPTRKVLRARARGNLDMGFMVLYFPSGHTPDCRRVFDQLLVWAGSIIQRLPQRCLLVILMDGNAHLGSTCGRTMQGVPLIGDSGAQPESCAGGRLRQFACRNELVL